MKWENAVRTAVTGSFCFLVLLASISGLHAQGSPQIKPSPVLSGTVASDREGPMEGVLVSAKKQGSTITVTVVSDAKGAYAFPAGRLEPGSYKLAIRASGYALDGADAVELAAGKAATADLKLKPSPVHIRAVDQRRNAGQRARSSRVEAQSAELHGLSFAASDFRIQAHPRRLPEGVRSDGRLLSGRLGHAAAAAGRRASASGGQSGAGGRLRRLSRSAQSQHQRHTASSSRPRRARPAAPPASSSPNTICRGKRFSPTT